MRTPIQISPITVTKFLLAIVFALLLANLAIIYLNIVLGYEHLKGFIHGFYFDTEANFPSLYSAMAIWLAAFLLWRIGATGAEKKARRSFYWKFLSMLFVFLGLDEFASIHEGLIQPAQRILSTFDLMSGYLYFAWLVPYLLLTIGVGLIVYKFVFSIPAHTRMLFIIAGVVFLCGAAGMEMVGGNYWAAQGWSVHGTDKIDIVYSMIVTVEELLEMVGIVIFIHALTAYYLRTAGSADIFIRIVEGVKQSSNSCARFRPFIWSRSAGFMRNEHAITQKFEQ